MFQKILWCLMVKDDQTLWVDSLLSDLAKNYRVVLNHDDPILVSAILNREILDKAYRDYQGLFVKNSQLLQQQFTIQKKMNDQLMSDVSHRLIESMKSTQTQSEFLDVDRDSIFPNSSISKAMLLLMFMFGLVLGILIGRLI